MKCPKCDFDQPDGNIECHRCGLVFSKFEAIQKKKDQVNARYSPGGRTESGEEILEESTPPEASAPAEPKTEQISALQLQDVKQQLQKLQLGVHGAMKFQEAMAEELQSQKGMVRQLFTLFSDLQGQLDQKVLALQGQLQALAENQQGIRQKLDRSDLLEEFQTVLDGLVTKVDKIVAGHREPRWVREMKPRLEKLESLHEQVRSALQQTPAGTSPEGLAAHETLLLKSEVQALRSEVRNLLEQTITPTAPAPLAPSLSKEALDQLEQRLQKSQRAIVQQLETARAAQNDAGKEREAIQTRVHEYESKISSMLAQKEFWMGLTEEISHLQQSFQTFHDAIRSELAQQYQLIQQGAQDLSDHQAAVSEIHVVLQRIRQALHSE
jgi:chromosome segregation ATPase